jgi:hypothetical protein
MNVTSARSSGGCHSAPGVGDTEEGGNRRGRRQRHHVHISDTSIGLVVIDLMLLLVELTLAKEVVDCFVILRIFFSIESLWCNDNIRTISRN